MAADWRYLPPGAVVLIHGVGVRVVEDKGGKVKGAHLDVYMGTNCRAAVVAGRKLGEVSILFDPRFP